MSASTRVKTCQTCATAKIRCLRSADSAICDRCLRLNKACYFRPARVRQTWSRKETRLESLEKRVDQLLDHRPANNANKASDVIDEGLVSVDDAAALLDYFLQFMMPHFPFVALPSQATASELRDEKPFLFLAILSVSVTDDHSLKQMLDDKMKAAVAERTVLTRQPPTLETLQGLLVVLTWSQHLVQRGFAPRDFSTYLHMAISIAVELELDRPAELRRRCHRMIVHKTNDRPNTPLVSQAEQRAVIGCSFLSSCFAIIRQKKNTFEWSHHLEAFAVGLGQDPEFSSDTSLVHLVRLQHILEQMDRISTDPEAGGTTRTGRSFQHTFRIFKAELQDFGDQLAPELPTNFLLACQLNTVNLYLCQISLFDKPTSQLSTGFQFEIITHGLAAAKDYFGLLPRLSPGAARCMGYSEWLQSGFSLILSCKLALMVASDENLRRDYPHLQSLCDDLDMSNVIKDCIEHQITQNPRPTFEKTGFDYIAWMQGIQDWYSKNTNAAIMQRRPLQQPQAQPHPTNTDTVPAGMPTSFPYQPDDFGGMTAPPVPTSMDLPMSVADESFPWMSFPSANVADDPLAGWMDLGYMPFWNGGMQV